MVVLIELPFYPYPKTKKKLHAVVQLFSFALFFGRPATNPYKNWNGIE